MYIDEINLSTFSTFGAISSEATFFLLARGTIYEIDKNEWLFKSGDPSDSFYIILVGDVDFFCKVGERKKIFQGRIKTGMEVGVTSMIALQPRWGSARMHSKGVVVKISTDVFHELQIHHNADFSILMINLMREVCRRFIRMSSLLGDIVLSDKNIILLNDSDRLL
ncbi:Crp/Fnr family transcriptional regulator [Marinobacterium nitratireducens]|nr:cyclic nucleotide-binding domain-containing protein [Marinobacterium nitratireducens]